MEVNRDQPGDFSIFDLEAEISIDYPPIAEFADGEATVSVINNGQHIALGVGVFLSPPPEDNQIFTEMEVTRPQDSIRNIDPNPNNFLPMGVAGLLRPGESASFKLYFEEYAPEQTIQFLRATCNAFPYDGNVVVDRPDDANPANDTAQEFYRVGGHADLKITVRLDINGDGVGDIPATLATIVYTDFLGNTVAAPLGSEGIFTLNNVLPAPGALSAKDPSGINPFVLISPQAGTNNIEVVIPVGNTVQPALVKGEDDPLVGGPQIWFYWDEQQTSAEASKNLGDWTHLTNSPFLLNPTTIVNDQPVKPNCGFVRTSE